MIPAAQVAALPHALAATAVAVVAGLPLGVLLARLPPAPAATLATALAAAVLLPGEGSIAADALPLLALVAVPPGWGLRTIPAATLRIAATLASPARVIRSVWLPLAAPWLLAGVALGFAGALARAGLVWPAGLLLAATAWPVLRALAARQG